MRRRKNNNKKVIILIAVVIAVVLIVVLIASLVNKSKKPTDDSQNEEQNIVRDLPDTKYSDMTVNNVQMEYLKQNNETMVSMTINNTTNRKVVNERVTALLLNESGEVLDKMNTFIDSLDINEQYNISVIFKGDLTSTTHIVLQEQK